MTDTAARVQRAPYGGVEDDASDTAAVPAEARANAEADRTAAEQRDDGDPESVKPKYVIGTTFFCLLFALFGHVVLWIAFSSGSNLVRGEAGLPPIAVWEAAIGVSVVGVAVIAFGGFYAATLRARVAIAASFLLTFLVILSYALTIRGFAGATVGDASALVGDFRAVVITVVGFYFGSEAIVSAVKVYGVMKSGGSARDVVRADRDLPMDRRGSSRAPIGGRFARR
jgi:hypothetical protein